MADCGCGVPKLASGQCPRCRRAERLIFAGIALVAGTVTFPGPMLYAYFGWL